MNVKGLNKEENKEVRMMMDVLALTEAKLKGEGEVSFVEYKRINGVVNKRVRARKGVEIVITDDWWKCVKDG